jgi:hypothetical protein
MPDFELVQRSLHEIGAGLEQPIINAAHNVTGFYFKDLGRTPLLAATASASKLLIKNSLNFQEYDPDSGFSLETGNPAAHTLAGLVLRGYRPPETVIDDALVLDLPRETSIDYCPTAEVDFAKILHRLRKPDTDEQPRTGTTSGYQLIMAGEEPAIIRKPELPSGLTLKPMLINGFYAPEGSLIGLKLEDDNPHDFPSKWIGELDHPEVKPVSDIARISLLRLTPWAFDPDKRKHAATAFNIVRQTSYTAAGLEELFQTGIDSIPELPGIRTLLQQAAEITPN